MTSKAFSEGIFCFSDEINFPFTFFKEPKIFQLPKTKVIRVLSLPIAQFFCFYYVRISDLELYENILCETIDSQMVAKNLACQKHLQGGHCEFFLLL
jgi:hypothetical protein